MSVGTIVVGVDGSENARRAIDWTAEIAAQTGATVVAVHAFRPLDHLAELEGSAGFEKVRKETEGRLRDNWCGPFEAARVKYRCVVMHGEASDVISDAAREAGADLIVVGARGLGAIRGLVLGSVSQRLVDTSPVPVTVIPASRED